MLLFALTNVKSPTEQWITDYGWILAAVLIFAGCVKYCIDNFKGYNDEPEGFDDDPAQN